MKVMDNYFTNHNYNVFAWGQRIFHGPKDRTIAEEWAAMSRKFLDSLFTGQTNGR